MKKFLLWLSIVLLCTSCIVTKARHPEEIKTLAEQLDDKTVALVLPVDDVIKPYCTGVWVSDRMILTAEHCVEIENEEDSEDYDPIGKSVSFAINTEVVGVDAPTKMHSAHVVSVSKEHDLALISTGDIIMHPNVEVSRDRLHDGDEVHVVGHTVGYWWSYMKGYVSSSSRNLEDPRGKTHELIQISIPIYKGNSGGGAFDSNGRLIGIASFIGRWPGLTFFVHRDEIVNFLKQNNVISRRP